MRWHKGNQWHGMRIAEHGMTIRDTSSPFLVTPCRRPTEKYSDVFVVNR